MIKRLIGVALCLGVTALVIGGLYWGFLNTPESQLMMLLLSAGLVLTMIALTAVAVSVAILIACGDGMAASLRTGARRAYWIVFAGAVGAIAIWGLLQGNAWIAQHSGQISAWFIATFNWADVTILFRIAEWIGVWLRWVLIPAAVVAVSAGLLRDGVRAVASSRWIRAAFRWRTLIIATVSFGLFIALPWRYAAWRPSSPIPTSFEPGVAVMRLAVVGVLMMIGAALIVLTSAREATRTRS